MDTSLSFWRLLGLLVSVLTSLRRCFAYRSLGALMIARVSFGGGLAIQGVTGFLSIISVGALGMAYYNVKRLQIDQHRAWMLRGWFYVRPLFPLSSDYNKHTYLLKPDGLDCHNTIDHVRNGRYYHPDRWLLCFVGVR